MPLNLPSNLEIYCIDSNMPQQIITLKLYQNKFQEKPHQLQYSLHSI
jgi:hypothetical protein